jgi:hypothetical protein
MVEKANAKDKGTSLRRITVKTVCEGKDGDIKGEMLAKVLKDKAKTFPVMRVWGVATRLKPGASDLGPFVRFLGAFRAVNIETGELFRAPVCLLPKFLEDQLAAGMGSGENVKPAEFAIEIGVKYDKTSATSYVYTGDEMIATTESDQMLQLEARIREENPKALPAPKS